MRLLNLLLLTLVLGFLTGASDFAFGQKSRPRARPRTTRAVAQSQIKASPEKARRLESFHKVWNTIDQLYFDPRYGGLDWQKIANSYEPRVAAAKSDADFHNLLHEMINRLGKSHLAIIPPDVFVEIQRVKTAAKEKEKRKVQDDNSDPDVDEMEDDDSSDIDLVQPFGVGIDIRMIDRHFVITRVRKDSTAAQAGLKPGFAIEQVNGESLTVLFTLFSKLYPKSSEFASQFPLELVTSLLNGDDESAVEITYLDELDQRKTVSVPRKPLAGQTVSLGANFPDQFLEYESFSINDEVGYIRFNQFAHPVIAKFCRSIDELKSKKGLIIDLRGNTGGLLVTVPVLAGMLSDKKVQLGTSIYRHREENWVAESRAKSFKGNIVILVDGTTASAAEMFAVSMQENRRAIVVGEITSGTTLPSIMIPLPTGAVMQLPIANYKSSRGVVVEGAGVRPDFAVNLDRKSLIAGKDIQFDKGLSLFDKFALPPMSALPTQPVPSAPLPPPDAKKVTGGRSNARAQDPPPPIASHPGRKPIVAQPLPSSIDQDSKKVIDDFLNAVGGVAAIKEIKSYSMTGEIVLNLGGSKEDLRYETLSSADKYLVTMSSASVGEIRQIYLGNRVISQTDFGVLDERPLFQNRGIIELIAPLRLLSDPENFSTIVSHGQHTRDGQSLNVLSATLRDGTTLGLAFDVQTKLLTFYTSEYFAMIFKDFRKTGTVNLPYSIVVENIADIQLEKIEVNSKIDDSNFQKKIYCFDQPN